MIRFVGRILFGLALLTPVAAGLFRVWVQQDSLQLGYALSERETERRALRNEVSQLEVELAAERAPARLMTLAKAVGLLPPAATQVVGGGVDKKGRANGRP